MIASAVVIIYGSINKHAAMAAAVIVAVGANLPSSTSTTLLDSCLQAVEQMHRIAGLRISSVSRRYESAPVPVSDQPPYVNGAVLGSFDGSPMRLLSEIHLIEVRHERQRTLANAARTLDLDLVNFDGLLQQEVYPVLPHPRAHKRLFVLMLIRDAAPWWRHPNFGHTVDELIEMLGADRSFCRPLQEGRTSGYEQDPKALLKTFDDGAEGHGETVVVSGIPIYSHCEHHLTPFFGHTSIGYIPNGTIVGLSKLPRLAHCFARRLQVQERLTMQIGDLLNERLEPKAGECASRAVIYAWRAGGSWRPARSR